MRQWDGCRGSGPNNVRAGFGVGLLAGNTVVQGVRATAWKRCRYPANCLAHAVLCHRELRRFPEENCCHEHEVCFNNEDGFGLFLLVYKMYVHVSYLCPTLRADSSEASAVRICNRVNDWQLACTSLQQDGSLATQKGGLSALLGQCRNTGLNSPRASGDEFGADSIKCSRLLGKRSSDQGRCRR